MRLGSNSALSTTSPLDNYNSAIKSNQLKLKNGGGVPDSFLVPMILRKTKLKQKQNHIMSPITNSIADHNSTDPRQNIFYQDLTLEPTQTNEEKEISRL